MNRKLNASYRVCTTGNLSGHMSGSDKSASETSRACHYSRTQTATRVAGTDDHLTRPDSENNSEAYDHKKQIADKNILTPAEIEVK